MERGERYQRLQLPPGLTALARAFWYPFLLARETRHDARALALWIAALGANNEKIAAHLAGADTSASDDSLSL